MNPKYPVGTYAIYAPKEYDDCSPLCGGDEVCVQDYDPSCTQGLNYYVVDGFNYGWWVKEEDLAPLGGKGAAEDNRAHLSTGYYNHVPVDTQAPPPEETDAQVVERAMTIICNMF